MSNLTYRFLTPDDFPQMYRSFLEAFSQYSVNMSMSKPAFSRRMKDKLNINFALSPAAFDGDKLVGFIFHAIEEYQGIKTAYNGGTGVLPEYWGQKITQNLFEFVKPHLLKKEVKRCLLEVITTNTPAINAYSKAGFITTKTYKCLKLLTKISKPISIESIQISATKETNLNELESLNDCEPSFLDSFYQLKHNLVNETVIEAHISEQLVGYLIYQQQLGRITQFAVHPNYRRQKVGTTLLHFAQENADINSLTLINVDEQDSAIINFLNSVGFENQLDQFEMELKL